MKTINFLKFASLLYLGYVNAAIPDCTETSSTDPSTGTATTTYGPAGKCCIKNGKLMTVAAGGTSAPTDITSITADGMYFLSDDTCTVFTSSATTLSYVIDVTYANSQVTVNDKEIIEKITPGYYLQGDNKVVKCTVSNNKPSCQVVTTTTVNNSYYIQGYKGGLIKFDSTATSNLTEMPASDVIEGYYINAESEGKLSNQLIQCTSDKVCTPVTASDTNVFIDALGGDGYLIICTDSGNTASGVVCVSNNSVTDGYFVNSSKLNGASKPLIECISGKCSEVSVPDTYSYYENGFAQYTSPLPTGLTVPTDSTKKIISCKGKCSYTDALSNGDYFVGTKGTDIPGIIKCVGADDSSAKCTYNAATAFKGYYYNAGGDKSTKQVIACDTTDGCVAKSVNPGYYVNEAKAVSDAGAENDFIKCTLNECSLIKISDIDTCKEEVNESVVCNNSGKLNFYEHNANTTVYEMDKNDKYVYTSIKSFPSISSETTTLFRISNYGIERFVANGVVAVDANNNQLITDFGSGSVGSEIDLYDCSATTKVCTKRSTCQDKTYMYDTENKKALLCKSNVLEDVSSIAGYYVDSANVVGTRTPYLIYCSSGECTHFAPTVASYYKNAGEDNDTNALIYCSGVTCSTVSVNSGYFVANQQSGIISCSSSSTCEYKAASNIGSGVNYVNAGIEKSSKALIYCSKKSCVPKAANVGYYFTDRVTNLIYCESSSHCTEIVPTVNYYFYADSSDNGKNYIINCSKVSTSVVCAKEMADTGSYLTSQSNVLVTCSSNGTCKQVVAKPGYYQSAVKITINSSRDVSGNDMEDDLVSEIASRDTTTTYNIIECTTTSCELLTAEELSSIPVCEYNADKCYITNSYALSKSAVTSISAGNLCTNADRSIFYFATDTIVVAPSVIAGTTSTYVYTTTTTNCLIVDGKHSDLYYTVGSDIYRLNDGSISHFYDTGYYFINIDKNTLITGNSIDSYNNENVKLYKCNGTACKILDNPKETTYYADVNKRIVKFNINSDSYSFAYEKDIVCSFANNKCTPNADLNGREFCITYKGELVLATQDIKNRETGECYKANSINSSIYGFNQYLYNMDIYSATVVDDNGYYLVSISTNSTISSKDYKNKVVSSNSIKIYGCHSSTCKVYEPEAGVYYYDSRAKTIIKKENKAWYAPSTSGYALVSVNPNEKFIYKFKSDLEEITLLSKAASGYYYTVDNEMYECNENDNECLPITETDYYFTNTGEIYYCVYDSENLEKTECTKQSCYVGQNYYISDNYYRCEAGSFFTPIKSRSCKYDENVVVNFPTILQEEFPIAIKQAIESIEKNNNSTAVAARSNKKYLSVVPAVFTNCTYNVEETEASYDLVCVNNFVAVNDEDDSIEICSMENLGYVECIEDEANPEKCTPSGAFSRTVFNFFTLAFAVFASLYLILF